MEISINRSGTFVFAKADNHFQMLEYDNVHCVKPSEFPLYRQYDPKDRYLPLYLAIYTQLDRPDREKDRYVPVDSNVAQNRSEQR